MIYNMTIWIYKKEKKKERKTPHFHSENFSQHFGSIFSSLLDEPTQSSFCFHPSYCLGTSKSWHLHGCFCFQNYWTEVLVLYLSMLFLSLQNCHCILNKTTRKTLLWRIPLLGLLCPCRWMLLLLFKSCCCHQVMSNSLQPYGLLHARLPYHSSSPGVCPSSCLLNWWCYSTISFSVALVSFCLQSFPSSGSFSMS